MAKSKTVYICQSCGAESFKWVGKCPSCNEWNTLTEEVVQVSKGKTVKQHAKNQAVLLSEIEVSEEQRIRTGSKEFDRILGGGIVPGSLILLGGEPGIGKSTLALQIALNLPKMRILYISGEESMNQIKMRANRFAGSPQLCYILSETRIEEIILQIKKTTPEFIVIDSIQTVYTERIESAPGSISQIRESAAVIMEFAKQNNVPVLIIGHINKEGNIAGPKILEHIVDTVLQFEGDRNHVYRILRTHKNRFGSTAELAIFEMNQHGLKEIENPSELLLSQNNEMYTGTAVSASIEGVRPFLIEVQALVSSAAYGTPQRSSTGFDLRRLNMLLAVLEKRAGFRLGQKDVFINIAGGIRVNDPAIDLAVICAVLSSDQEVSIEKTTCFAGEIGLTGEIRPVNRVEQRIKEAQKLGFDRIVVSKYNLQGIDTSRFNIKISTASRIEELLSELFG